MYTQQLNLSQDADANKQIILQACESGNVFLPSGRYPLNGLVITGQQLTKLKNFFAVTTCVFFNNLDTQPPISFVSDRFTYSNQLYQTTSQITDFQPCPLEVGDLVYLGDIDTNLKERTNHVQICKITSVSGNTAQLDTPLVYTSVPGRLRQWKAIKARKVKGANKGSVAVELLDGAGIGLFKVGQNLLVTDGYGVIEVYAEPIRIKSIVGKILFLHEPLKRDYRPDYSAVMYGPHPSFNLNNVEIEPPVYGGQSVQVPFYFKGILNGNINGLTITAPYQTDPAGFVNCYNIKVNKLKAPNGLFNFNSCENIFISNSAATAAGSEEYTRNIHFRKCKFRDCGTAGYTYQTGLIVEDCEVSSFLALSEGALIKNTKITYQPGWDGIYCNTKNNRFENVDSDVPLRVRAKGTVITGGRWTNIITEDYPNGYDGPQDGPAQAMVANVEIG